MELWETQSSGITVKIFLGSMILKYLISLGVSWSTICDKPYIVVKCDDERIMMIIKIKQHLTIIRSFCLPGTVLRVLYLLIKKIFITTL